MSCKRDILASVAGGVTPRVNQNTTCGVSSTLRAGKGGLNNMNATITQELTVSKTWLYDPKGGDYLAIDQRVEVIKALSKRLKSLGLDYKVRISEHGARGFVMLSDGRVYNLRTVNSKVFKRLSQMIDRLEAYRSGEAEVRVMRRKTSVAEAVAEYNSS